MMEEMDYLAYVALAVGVVITLSRLVIKDKLDEIILVFESFQHRKKEDFYVFYDFMSEGVYQFFIDTIKDPKIKTKEQFYRLHDSARGAMYGIFTHYRVNATKDVMYRVLPLILLPCILFWSYWYFYIIGVVLAAVLLIVYKILVKDEVLLDTDVVVLSRSYSRYLSRKK
jgi:hypothetical protein